MKTRMTAALTLPAALLALSACGSDDTEPETDDVTTSAAAPPEPSESEATSAAPEETEESEAGDPEIIRVDCPDGLEDGTYTRQSDGTYTFSDGNDEFRFTFAELQAMNAQYGCEVVD